MFVDYYGLLEVEETATLEQIKIAFRKQAIKWHPDRNQGKDTTRKMQLINEAYLILKDSEAKNRFDIEYQTFKTYKQAQECRQKENTKREEQKEDKETKFEYQNYSFRDGILKKWMANAKKQAIDLAKQTIKEFGGMVTVGVKEGTKAAGQTFLIQLAIGLIFIMAFSLSRGCN